MPVTRGGSPRPSRPPRPHQGKAAARGGSGRAPGHSLRCHEHREQQFGNRQPGQPEFSSKVSFFFFFLNGN